MLNAFPPSIHPSASHILNARNSFSHGAKNETDGQAAFLFFKLCNGHLPNFCLSFLLLSAWMVSPSSGTAVAAHPQHAGDVRWKVLLFFLSFLLSFFSFSHFTCLVLSFYLLGFSFLNCCLSPLTVKVKKLCCSDTKLPSPHRSFSRSFLPEASLFFLLLWPSLRQQAAATATKTGSEWSKLEVCC